MSSIGSKISHNILLGRWRLSLDLFGRVFMEDVGLEAGSIVSELGGFPVKEAKFRRDMEKLRNSQQKDITLSKVRSAGCFFFACGRGWFFFLGFVGERLRGLF